MKKNTILTIFLFATTALFSQDCNLVLFSEGGESFYLILNGIKHNQTPETNVKVQALPEAPFKAKVIFEDTRLGIVEKTLYTTSNKETTYSIVFQGDTKAEKEAKKIGNAVIKSIGNTGSYKERKKEYKIKLVSQTPIPTTPNRNLNQNSSANTDVRTNVNTSETVTTRTTTNVKSDQTPNNASISMNVNISDNMDDDANMNVNITGNDTYTQTTSITTTTSTTGNVNSGSVVTRNNKCDYPMDNSDFLEGKNSIKSKTFADSKMTIAKQITKNNCPTASQIRDYTKLFTFENDKLEYAKFAYSYCYDTANYYKVNDAFEFESSIEDLNEHIGN